MTTKPIESPPTSLAARRSGERGSAFIVTLLALVILTILGLSLVFITTGEMQVGANERNVNRVFYSADAGLGVAAARAMFNDGSAMSLDLTDKDELPTAGVRNAINLATSVLVSQITCDLCTVANGSEYGGDAVYKKVGRVLTSQSVRINDNTGVVHGRKEVAAILEIVPMREAIDPLLEIAVLEGDELLKPKL